MPLKKEQKVKLVDEIGADIKKKGAVIFIDFKGVKIKPLEKLRQELKASGSALRVVRKSFLTRAVHDAFGKEDYGVFNAKKLDGQVAVIFGDVLTAAKSCASFARQEKTFKFLGGIFEGRVLSAQETIALAAIPSRQELLAQLAFVLNSPIQGLAIAFNEISKKKQ